MSDYTPSLDEGRRAWILSRQYATTSAGYDRAEVEFDRMIEAVRADEREKVALMVEQETRSNPARLGVPS